MPFCSKYLFCYNLTLSFAKKIVMLPPQSMVKLWRELAKGASCVEIKQLEYFLAVSETKSFTRAAERLFVSQPSVTNIIRNLEDELGIQLFERSQKQMLLTSEGRIFHSHVEHLMKGISHTLEEIAAIKNLNGGELSVKP